MPPDQLRINDSTISALAAAFVNGEHGLSVLPGLLKRAIREGAWQERIVHQTKQTVRFNTFAEFVSAYPPDGLHTDIATVKRLCRDDAEAIDLIDEAIGSRQGERTDIVDNIHEVERPTGTSARAAIRRLRTQRPDLHKRVLAGELSPHAAAVEAGFRPRTLSIALDPDRIATALVRHLSPEQLHTLVRLLAERIAVEA